MVLSPQNRISFEGDRLWFCTCTLLTIGIVAAVVALFTTASFVQEHLIKFPLKLFCPGQGSMLLHTCRPGKLWWAWHSQNKGWWKRSLHSGFSDFFPLFTLRSCCNYAFSKCVHIYFIAGDYCLVLFLLLSLRGRDMQAINGWLFSSKPVPATAQWLWQLKPFPHQAGVLPKEGVWPRVAADVACKSGVHLGALLHSSAGALAGEDVWKIIHPQLLSGLGKLWKTFSVFLITVLAENILRTFFKDTGFKKHYAELLKMQSYLCLRVTARFQEGWNRDPQGWIFHWTII